MTREPVRIEAPRINPNEDSVVLVKWIKAAGGAVSSGDAIAEVESSKTVLELQAPENGYLHYALEPGAELPVGGLLAVITSDKQTPADVFRAPDAGTRRGAAQAGAPRMSAKARKLALELGIGAEAFAGMEIVRAEDVQRIARGENAGNAELLPLSPIQRRVRAAVEESMRSIPASSVEMRTDAAGIQRKAMALSRKHRLMISPVVLAIAGFARALKDFPVFNATLEASGVRLWREVNVNVLMEIEGELLNPVIRNAGARDVADLARELGELQKKAGMNKLKQEELAGGTVSVTSLYGTDVCRVSPIIYPGQTAILALSGVDALQPAQTITWVLAFDHRVANALCASRLLKAAISGIEEL